jgi:hypothetical protein
LIAINVAPHRGATLFVTGHPLPGNVHKERIVGRTYRAGVALLATFAVAGCATLLPTAEVKVSGPWRSFEEAKAAIERIEPNRTSTADLRTSGIDPEGPNVQLLSYSDILLRFPMGVSAAQGPMNSGLHECLAAGKSCTGYAISVRETNHDRTGSFWLDALGFKRVVDTTGWQFNALILLVGDRVVYTLYSGQPQVREHEVTRHPLGPIQNIGDAVSVGNLGR